MFIRVLGISYKCFSNQTLNIRLNTSGDEFCLGHWGVWGSFNIILPSPSRPCWRWSVPDTPSSFCKSGKKKLAIDRIEFSNIINHNKKKSSVFPLPLFGHPQPQSLGFPGGHEALSNHFYRLYFGLTLSVTLSLLICGNRLCYRKFWNELIS